MSYARDNIRIQQTYRTYHGSLVYVQDIDGQKVTYNTVGDFERKQASLGRFAGMVTEEVENG